MNNELYSRALETIFFNQQKVSKLNELAKEIDPRLFLFAPFKPMPLPKNTCAQGCFYLSVINGYGLVWDCGRVFWEIFRRPQKLLERLGLSTGRGAKATRFLWNIHAIRTDVCHASGYSLIDNGKKHEEYLFEITHKNMASNAEKDWETICNAFYDQHDDTIDMVGNVLGAIESSKEFREEIIVNMIDTVCSAWQQKQEPLLVALEHLYWLADEHKMLTPNRRLKWLELKTWVESGCSKQPDINNQPRDFESFKTDISDKFVKLILNKDACPNTTDPMELFVDTIKSNYAWRDGSFRVLDS